MNWLSQVIAGKQRPISLGIEGPKKKDERKDSNPETDVAARNAAAIDVLRRIFPQQHEPATPEPIPPSAPVESAASEPAHPEAAPTAANSDSAAVEGVVVTNDVFDVFAAEPSVAESFSAEDLCGAPVVPLIMAAPAAIDEITAADVCWVPPGRELHPEPLAESIAAAAEPVAASAESVDQTPDSATVDEVLTRIEASTAVETPEAPAVEATATVEATPAEEPAAAVEVPLAEESAPAVEAAMPVETMPAAEAAPEESPAATEPEAIVEPEAIAEAPIEAAPDAQPEAQPEVEPQEITASLPENAFANGEIWRTATELTADPNGNGHHEVAPADMEAPAAQEVMAGPETEPTPRPAEPSEFDHHETSQPEDLLVAMKALIRLNSAIPWLAQANSIEPALMPEVRDEVAGMRLVQYEIKTAVQDHSLQLKRMEENLTRVRDIVQASAGEDIAETVKSTARAVRVAMIGTGATLVLVLIMIGMLLARAH